MINRLIWLFPFIFFLAGYYSMHIIYHTDEIPTPSLIGMQLPDAFTLLSQHNLYPRILREKEDSDMPAGTILSQTPAPATQIKPQQSVFLVISKPAPLPRAPNCVNASKKAVLREAQARNIRTKLYSLPSIYPLDQCFAQFPSANRPVTDNTMIAYLSAGNRKPILLPNFKQLTIREAQEHLIGQSITLQITHTRPAPPHECSSCIILDQRPLAGSIVTLDESKPLQLNVQAMYQY
jgi:serine/threonine-protein kinase